MCYNTTPSGIYCLRILGEVPKQTKIVPKRKKVTKKTFIVIPILRTTGAERNNCSTETEKIGAKNAKIQSAEKSAGMGGNPVEAVEAYLNFIKSFWFDHIGSESFCVQNYSHRTNNHVEAFYRKLNQKMHGCRVNLWVCISM